MRQQQITFHFGQPLIMRLMANLRLLSTNICSLHSSNKQSKLNINKPYALHKIKEIKKHNIM